MYIMYLIVLNVIALPMETNVHAYTIHHIIVCIVYHNAPLFTGAEGQVCPFVIVNSTPDLLCWCMIFI